MNHYTRVFLLTFGGILAAILFFVIGLGLIYLAGTALATGHYVAGAIFALLDIGFVAALWTGATYLDER
jgi:hypothetical protein